jgi:hypothetical protein
LWGGEFLKAGYSVVPVYQHGSEEVIKRYIKKQGHELEQYKQSPTHKLHLFGFQTTPPQAAG